MPTFEWLHYGIAVSSSPRPWMDVFALPEKFNMTHDFVRGQSVAETCFSHWGYTMGLHSTMVING